MHANLVNLENIKEKNWSENEIFDFEDIAFNKQADEEEAQNNDDKLEWQAYFLNKRNKKIDDLNATTVFSHTYPVEIDALTKKCVKRNLYELIEPNLFKKRILKFSPIYFTNFNNNKIIKLVNN